jgi:hypothetical protein
MFSSINGSYGYLLRNRILFPILFVLAVYSIGACDDPKEEPNICGNQILDSQEDCDGDLFSGHSCESMGFNGGFLLCTSSCDVDISSCEGYSPLCGNSVIDGYEQCDNQNLNSISCTTMGYEGGELSCTVSCEFDSSGCFGDCPVNCISGSKQCNDTTLQICTPQAAENCNNWESIEDCLDADKICIEPSIGQASCSDGCLSPCDDLDELQCSTDGSAIETCTWIDNKGCSNWETTPCDDTGVCDDSSDTPACIYPCISDCTIGDTFKCSDDSTTIQVCDEVEEGCFKWVFNISCEEGSICNQGNLTCVTQGNGETCNSPFYIPNYPYTIDGTDFNLDFSDDATQMGDGIGCGTGGDGGDLYLELFIKDSEAILITTSTDLPLEISLMESCLEGDSCISSEDGELWFSPESDGIYKIVIESWSQAHTGPYSITVSKSQILNNGDECNPDFSSGNCGDNLFCGYDSDSSSGYSCMMIMEGNLCSQVITAVEGSNYGMFQGLSDDYNSGCFSEQNVDQIWEFTPTESGTYFVSLNEFTYEANLYAKTECTLSATPILCSEAKGSDDASLLINLIQNDSLFLFAEKKNQIFSTNITYEYNLQIMKLLTNEINNCGDGLDNDLDGEGDCSDSDCFGDITYCATETICNDSQDNDQDGTIDCNDANCMLDPNCLQKRGYYQLFTGDEDSPDLSEWRLTFTPTSSIDYSWVATHDASFFTQPGSQGSTVQVLDDYLYEFTLPFAFPFSGFQWDTVYVSSNGWLSFENPGSSLPFESSLLLFQYPVIAVLWDDLTKINFGDTFFIDWGVSVDGLGWWAFTFKNREYNSPSNILYAQVVLFENGTIRIDYETASTDDGLIGIGAPGIDPEPSMVNFKP